MAGYVCNAKCVYKPFALNSGNVRLGYSDSFPSERELLRALLHLILKEKVLTNTYVVYKLRQRFRIPKHASKKFSDKVRYLLKKLKRKRVIKTRKISAHLYEITLKDLNALIDLINKSDCPKHVNLVHGCLSPKFARASNIWLSVAKVYWKTSKITNEDIEEVLEAFEFYLEDINIKVLVFVDEDGYLHFKKYRTRFNDKSILVKQLKKLEEAFKVASSKYNSAVFLTLTIPPIFPLKLRLWILSFLLHRLKAFIRRREGKTKPHIKVVEPQASFNPHFHVVIFDLDFIMDKRELTRFLDNHLENFLLNLGDYYKKTINNRASSLAVEYLNKYGKKMFKRYRRYKRKHSSYEGPINYVSKVKREKNAFCFLSPPPEIKPLSKSVFDYVKKYIKKAINEVSKGEVTADVAFYWLMRVSFYSLSPSLRKKSPPKEPSGWIFVGSFYADEVEEWESNTVLG